MEFGILGPLDVRDERGPIPLEGIKLRALLAVLLLHPNEAVHIERIAVALWGEDTPATASKSVHVYVSRLRKALGDPEALITTPAGYRLRVRDDELDAERFVRLVDRGRHMLDAGQAADAAAVLREALALWRGRALADLAFEQFAQADIARLEEQRLAALEARIDADLAVGQHAQLVGELRQLVYAHGTRERMAAQLMLALYRCGQQTAALDVFHVARNVLLDEIGVEPGREMRDLQQAVLSHDPCLNAPPTTVSSVLDRAAALPAPPTDLFGREDDLDELIGLVRWTPGRLVTLVGPGGVGKTRLAIEAGRRLARDFRDGARLVALASVTEARDLAPAIARSLAAPTREGEPAKVALRRYLVDRHMLLIVDNFEQVVTEASLLADLLATCPELRILATSREPTRIAAERLYPVRSLEVPEAHPAPTIAELERFGAVAMFVDRSRARDPAFALDETTAAHVCEICRRLDGLPLALELAAARIGLLSTAELASRLDQSLSVLTGGGRDAPERQRTLRSTIDWSFNLLSQPERETFTHLAVFASGTTVAAAENVTHAMLDTLESLVAKQLLERRGDRLLMLETVRAYALEHLTQSPGAGTVYEQFAAWCLSFARQATPHLVRADRIAWLARLDAELPNALAALSWALSHRRGELALELVSELGAYWWHTNQWEQGLPWIDAVLEQPGDASTHAQARALFCRARLLGLRHEEAYRTTLLGSLKLFRSCRDAAGIATCLAHLADLEAFYGRFDTAKELSDESLALAQSSQDPAVIADVLMLRSGTATSYNEMSQLSRTAIEHLQRLGSLDEIANICAWTGYEAIVERQYQDALTWLAEGLDAARKLENPRLTFHLRTNQGLAKLFLNALDEAAHAFGDALALCCEGGCEEIIDETLLGVAVIAARRGELRRAARLAGAAERHLTASQSIGEIAIRARLTDEISARQQESAVQETWQRAIAEGASLTVNQALELALAGGGFASATPGNRAPT